MFKVYIPKDFVIQLKFQIKIDICTKNHTKWDPNIKEDNNDVRDNLT